MKKRVLAALLALVMLFGALPMSVFAVDEDVVPYADELGTGEPTDVPSLAGSDNPMLTAYCTTNGHSHSSGSFSIRYNNLYGTAPSAAEYNSASGIWEYKVPVNKDAALERWKNDQPSSSVEHILADNDPLYVVWAYESGTWTLKTKLVQLEIKAKDSSSGSTTPTGKPAALSKTHYFTIDCTTPGCTAHDSTIFGYMYHPVETNDPYTYTIEFLPDKVNDDLKYSNHQLRETSTGYQIDPMRITWQWEDGEWKGTSRACDDTGWPYNVYAFVESTASSSTEEPTTVNVFVKGIDFSGKDLSASQLKSTDFGSKTVGDYYHVGSLTTTQTLTDMEQEGLENTDPVKTFVYQQMAKGAETWTPASGVEKNFTWARQILFTELKKQNDGTYNLYGQILAYKLALDLQGGTLANDMVSGYYLSGSEVTLPVLTKQNYTFLGWEEQELGGGDDGGTIVLALNEAVSQPQTIEVSYDVTYVANWQENPYLTLTYNANAPEGKTVTNLPAPQKEYLQAGSGVVTFQLSEDIPACEGYKFLGWRADLKFNNPTFPVENLGTDSWVSTTGEPNYILYAIWEKNPFHVTYRLKDENGKWVNAYEEDVPVAGCENHTLWTPAEKTGYKFTGWYQKAEDIGKKAEVTKLFDKTWVLYGDYTPVEYTITYDYRDKDIADKNLYPENAETYTIEDTVTLNPITNKGMFGKTFLEWRCDLNKDGVAEKITEIPAGTTGNLTVYAYWNYPVSYTVYDEDGNEVEAYCETINVPEDSFGANLKPKSVEKDGYEFDGWYQNPKNFGNPNKRTETLDNAKNWKLYGKLKYLEKPVYVYVQPTYKGIALTKSDAKAVAALARLGFTEGFNAGGKFVTLGKMMTAKTDVAGMVDEIDNGKLALYSEIDTEKFNERVLNSIGWYGENALELVTNTTHKGYEADGKIDAYHLNGTMSFQSVTFDAGTNDKVENMPADGYYLVNDRITLSAPTREGYTFLGWSAAQDTPVITANPETDGETLYPADHEWTVIGDVTFTAVWELNLQTVNVVIYRNGDMTKAFKTVSLEKQPKGTVIDLTTLDIANYYTANSTGKYDFYGWYNDGRWNEYKANPENPPAGLEKITVNGWTNIICMVYDYEKVIVKAITDDNKATETQLFSGMARRGSNLLDYLAAQNIELDKVGHTHDEWYKYDSPKWKFGENDTINGWTNVLVKYARKEYTVVAKMYLDGAPHYRQNTDFYTYQVTGLYGDPIDFADIKAQAIAQAEKDRPASASYDASVIEDWAGNATCTTFGEHQPDLDTPHYVNVHVNTTQHVYVYRMIDGKMEATEYHHSTAPFGANVVEHLNANVQNLDMPGYSHDEWFMKDVPALDVKFGDTDTINGWTNVVIKYTKNEFPVTYDYACTDPALVPNWKVWETLPENPYTYAPGESVRVAMMPDDVEDGEYIWKFVTWKLNGVDVVPNAQVPMVEGGLTFVGIWERTQKEYGVTYDYACTDPELVPNWKVWATLPENKDTYTVGQKVTTAAKPDDVEDGEYIWKFITWKLGDTEVAPNTQVEMVAGGLTFVGIWERTQKEYNVTYSYDPSLPAEVQATIPKDPDTYTVGQKVTTAAKPNSVRVGENIWTFKTWKLDGVEVAPNTQVEMVSGGLHFEGIWETKLIHYSLTIQYVDKKGKELAESHMDLLSKGEAYKVDSPKIKGYKLKDKDKAVIEGTMPGRNLTIEVVYIKKSTGGGSGTIDSPNKPTTKAPALTLNTDDHFAFINGYPDGSVQPEGNVTRAETAAILYRIMGDACQSYYKTNSSSYSDVARGDWYNTYVATLENAGVIVDTRTNGKFRPNDAITRAELASMIAQFAGLESASAAKFNDVGSRYWAAEEIAIAAKMGWINGYPDGSFRPDRNVTRAELMAMVNRALGRTPKSADDLLSGMKTWRDNANVNAWYYLDVQEATNDHTYTKSGTHETWKKLL